MARGRRILTLVIGVLLLFGIFRTLNPKETNLQQSYTKNPLSELRVKQEEDTDDSVLKDGKYDKPNVNKPIEPPYDSILEKGKLLRDIVTFQEKTCKINGHHIAVIDNYSPWKSSKGAFIPLTAIGPSSFFSVNCEYLDKTGQVIGTGSGTSESVSESHGQIYQNILIMCRVELDIVDEVLSVRFKDVSCSASFDVKPAILKPHFDLAVCVSPIYSEEIDTTQAALVEWFEYHRESGFDHFYVYMSRVGPRTRAILLFYQSLGLITLMDWRLYSVGEWNKGWYFNQNGALNDCMQRFRHESKYLGFFDIDEFVFPRRGLKDTNDLINLWEKQPSFDSMTHMVLLNWFYGSMITPHPTGNNLLIAQLINRKAEHFPSTRQKYILKPQMNGFVHTHNPSGNYGFHVSVNQAFMVHFQTVHAKLCWDPHTQTTDREFAEQAILDKVELRVARMEYELQKYRRDNNLIKKGRE
jgi:hypothetical protein